MGQFSHTLVMSYWWEGVLVLSEYIQPLVISDTQSDFSKSFVVTQMQESII